MDNRVYLITFVALGVALSACGGGNGPTADAGPDVSASVGEQVRFDGSGSTGDIVNCKWTILEPPETMPGDAGKIIRDSADDCVFTLDEAMVAEYVGEWLIELEVTDSAGRTATDTVMVEVQP